MQRVNLSPFPLHFPFIFSLSIFSQPGRHNLRNPDAYRSMGTQQFTFIMQFRQIEPLLKCISHSGLQQSAQEEIDDFQWLLHYLHKNLCSKLWFFFLYLILLSQQATTLHKLPSTSRSIKVVNTGVKAKRFLENIEIIQ